VAHPTVEQPVERCDVGDASTRAVVAIGPEGGWVPFELAMFERLVALRLAEEKLDEAQKEYTKVKSDQFSDEEVKDEAKRQLDLAQTQVEQCNRSFNIASQNCETLNTILNTLAIQHKRAADNLHSLQANSSRLSQCWYPCLHALAFTHSPTDSLARAHNHTLNHRFWNSNVKSACIEIKSPPQHSPYQS
jgi:hypothetical protein